MDGFSTIATMILVSTKEMFIIPFLVLGFFIFNRDIIARLLYITLLTMIVSTFLKSIWQIPLPEHLNSQGWAFPSGHMQFAVVFWGWLAWEVRKTWVSITVATMIALVGWALIYLGYHSLRDIIGAFAFGTLSLVIYSQTLRWSTLDSKLSIGMISTFIGGVMIAFLPHNFPHVWIAEGAIAGFTLGLFVHAHVKLRRADAMLQKLAQLFIAFVGIAVLYSVVSILPLGLSSKNFIQFSLIAFWVSVGVDLTLLPYTRAESQ